MAKTNEGERGMMANRRSKERDEARAIFLREKGKIKPKEIAEQLGVSPALVRKWKCDDRWEEELRRPKKGGQPGNQNAKGHGAPEGNQNSVTHGAYCTPRLENMTPEQREQIEAVKADFNDSVARELRRLEAKRIDLEQRIAALMAVTDEKDEAKYLDRKTIVKLPGKGGKMEYTSLSSAFSRRMTLEAELNKVDGRIIKILDSLRSAEAEGRRIEIEKRRMDLAWQKATGCFNVGDDGGPAEDDEDDEEEVEIVET